ncbi:hypothetical protein P3X46_027145 [Hevea brasiliensis]|uniref:START domain-containing protein n=1 Tax=Hevea brasiliensis TaxID=3981 RepID=A0ABQ9L0E6_HEVBR|nr:hypothetical protein P3X46_027145 [Hevea brasiliensis]
MSRSTGGDYQGTRNDDLEEMAGPDYQGTRSDDLEEMAGPGIHTGRVSLGSEENKTKISELANSAMEELVRKALLGEPLWQRQAVLDTEIEILNEAEYIREFRAFDASLQEIMRMIEVGDPQHEGRIPYAYTTGSYKRVSICKVTWVEHVEVDNKQVHRIFHPQVRSGFAYSARRWVTTLIQHCDWVATLMSQTVPVLDGGLVSQNGKENLLRLAERMMRSFCTDLSACSNNLWMPLPVSGGEDVRVMTKSITPATSECPSTTIAFTSSIWLPFPPRRVYDFLRHEDSRNKWDLLSRELVIQELTYINKGDNPDNRISILQANSDSSEIEILYLQESYSDPTAFYIVYAPMDITSVATILKGGNTDYVNILPSGFVIHPDRQVMNNNGKEVGGSLLTLAFHILDGSSMEDSQFIPRESVDTVYRILTETAILIKAALLSDDP